VAPAFLDAMVCCTSTPAEVQLWEGILRDSFGALKSFSFLDAEKSEGAMKRWVRVSRVVYHWVNECVDGGWLAVWVGMFVLPHVLQLPNCIHRLLPLSPLGRLDIVTQCPGMKRCLAALLTREALAAAGARGREFESRSILAPLLAVGTLARYGQHSVLPLTFPAKDCFMQLRWGGLVEWGGWMGRRAAVLIG